MYCITWARQTFNLRQFERRLIMSDLAILVKHLVKEAVHPRLHHKDLQEYLDDVDRDVFNETHNYNYTKYISKLYELL